MPAGCAGAAAAGSGPGGQQFGVDAGQRARQPPAGPRQAVQSVRQAALDAAAGAYTQGKPVPRHVTISLVAGLHAPREVAQG